MANDFDGGRRDLLKTAIADIQGSIHANDSKSAAVLVVQGLLFTGVLTVTSRLGAVFTDAGPTSRLVIALALGGALAFFVLSVGAVLFAIIPYSPGKAFVERLLSGKTIPQLYFPDLKRLGKHRPQRDELAVFVDELHQAQQADMEADLAFELLKVQDIRRHDARFTTIGFYLLLPEVACVLVFLSVIGGAALGHHR